MARYQNGLFLEKSESNVGAAFARWLFEFLTQVVGWAVHDKAVGTKWDNYIASGSSTATTSDTETIDITSPGYAFALSDVGRYLTLVGFSTPEEDGIYRILEYVSVLGDVYTIKVDKRMGPHSDGFTAAETVDWALWSSDDAYTPDQGDIAVVIGKGKTGAGTTTGDGTGDDISMVGSVATLTDAGANFQTSDVGKDITISNASNPGNNGTFAIASRISATQITYNNASGVNETSAFDWQITYDYHLKIEVDSTTNSRYPKLEVSPFASWDNVGHAWTDSRYTSEITYGDGGDNSGRQSRVVCWAEADEYNLRVVHRGWTMPGYGYLHWYYTLAGEIDTYYPDRDPKPVVVGAGRFRYEWYDPIGPWQHSDNTWAYGVAGLSYDETTTLVYYLNAPVVPTNTDAWNWMANHRRRWSQYSGKQYRAKLVLESRTSGHMEYRGTLRDVYYTNHHTQHFALFKVGSDWWAHMAGGLLFPWNGARNWFIYTSWDSAGGG